MTDSDDLGACSLWFAHALLEEGWADRVRVTVTEGAIAAVDTETEPRAQDERHGVALPGLSNVHSHAFQRGMAGLAETRGPAGDNFWTWREAMYRFLDRGGPEEIEAITAMAYVEMLEGGFTRVGEFHYLHNDPDGRPYQNPAELAARVAQAAAETGIALTLLPVFYAHATFGGAPPARGQRRFINDVPGFARLLEASRAAVAGLPDAVVGVAPHSLRAVTPEELADVLALSDGPIHIHAAEQVREVEDCVAWSGARPVEWLLANAQVDGRWCLVHATHLTADETVGLARSGAVAGLCPVTEANLGDGIFPASDYVSAGGRFGVGTDSNVLIGVAEELRMLEYAQRLSLRSRNVLARAEGRSTGQDLFQAAAAGGFQATGAAGGLANGRSADIVALDLTHPALASREPQTIIDSWVFAADRSMVQTVWRAGRKVVSEGRHARRPQVTERYRRALGVVLG